MRRFCGVSAAFLRRFWRADLQPAVAGLPGLPRVVLLPGVCAAPSESGGRRRGKRERRGGDEVKAAESAVEEINKRGEKKRGQERGEKKRGKERGEKKRGNERGGALPLPLLALHRD